MNFIKGRRHIFAMIISIVVSLTMVYLITLNYSDFSDKLISNEQKRLLAVADAIATSIQENVRANEEFLAIIKEDQKITSYLNNSESAIYDFQPVLKKFVEINKSGIIKLAVYNASGDLLGEYSKLNTHHTNDEQLKELNKVIIEREPSIGDTFFPEDGSPFYNIYMPVFSGVKFVGVIRGLIETDYIYETIVKPVEIGIVGYASVKTDDTILLMHPTSQDIGQEVMAARRNKYPDYDWSGLERVVGEQMENKHGVGIYNSIWAGDDSGTWVKKFSAYSSVDLGEHFWIVNISGDYNQVVEVIRKNYYITLVISAMIFMGLILAMIIFLITKQKQRELEESVKHNEALEKLNTELEKDIEERKKLQIELSKSIKKYTAIFSYTQNSVLIFDFENRKLGSMIDQNKQAKVAFGYSENDGVSLVDMDCERSAENLGGQLTELEEGESIRYETTLMGKNRKKIPAEVQCTIIELDSKPRILFIANDISKRKQEEQILMRSERRFMSIVNELATRMKDSKYEVDTIDFESTSMINLKLEKINILLEQLFKKELDENRKKESLMIMQSKNAAMGEMIGNIAHQWRQPLNTLNLVLTNLKDELEEHDLEQELLAYIDKKFDKGFSLITKMSDTIDDFRNFFQPQDARKDFDVRETIDATIHLFDERLRLYDIEINVAETPKPVSYFGYSNQLSQVLLNIINNSIDAHKENITNRQKNININYEKTMNSVIITLTDNAGGINNHVLKKIFAPYFTTKDAQNGTGLGLYMSKTIIEKHFNGSLTAFNIEEGACFKITLNLSTEDENEG